MDIRTIHTCDGYVLYKTLFSTLWISKMTKHLLNFKVVHEQLKLIFFCLSGDPTSQFWHRFSTPQHHLSFLAPCSLSKISQAQYPFKPNSAEVDKNVLWSNNFFIVHFIKHFCHLCYPTFKKCLSNNSYSAVWLICV